MPLKIVELSDFIRSPSILSKRLEYKQTNAGQPSSDQSIRDEQDLNSVKSKKTQKSIVLLRKTAICTDKHDDEECSKQKELIVPKDTIVFADDVDRQKIGLFNKSKNYFSRLVKIL